MSEYQETKYCRRCEKTKPIEEFRLINGKNGPFRFTYCHPCHNLYQRDFARRKAALRPPPPTSNERFWDTVDKESTPDGCWPWKRIRPNGDPVSFHWDNRSCRPRRYLWTEILGNELASDDVVRCTCGNMACVNPAHLYAENVVVPAPEGHKKCGRCKELKRLEDFSSGNSGYGKHGWCRVCKAESMQERLKDPVKKERMVSLRKMREFGISMEELEDLRRQSNGVCCMCSLPGGKHGLCIDHDHETGVVRSLLCSSCNAGIAMFKHDIFRLQRAIDYLIKWDSIIASKHTQVELDLTSLVAVD